jgi:hypothetical protein
MNPTNSINPMNRENRRTSNVECRKKESLCDFKKGLRLKGVRNTVVLSSPLKKKTEYLPSAFCGSSFDIGYSLFHPAGQVAPQALPDIDRVTDHEKLSGNYIMSVQK